MAADDGSTRQIIELFVLCFNGGCMDIAEKFTSFPSYEPSDNFPWRELPQLIRATVLEICANEKVATPLAVQTVLSAVSLACQDLIVVDRGIGCQSPCSLFMLAVADSGSRKTRVDRAIMPAIEEYDKINEEKYKAELLSYKNSLEYLNSKKKSAEKILHVLNRNFHLASDEEKESARLKLQKMDDEFHSLIERLTDLEEPKQRKFLYSSVSIVDLERGLSEKWPSAGLFSSEAADILNSKSEADMARLDRLWDGQNIDVVGKSARDVYSVVDPRLTLSLMIQPVVFDRFMERKGELAKGVGFLPRALLCRPATLYGQRYLDENLQISTEWIQIFNSRVICLLKQSQSNIADRKSSRVVLKLSSSAQLLWRNDFNEKEEKTIEGGELYFEREYVSRYSEHVARLAALFCFFEENLQSEYVGDAVSRIEISEDYVKRAIAISEWYMNEFSSIANPEKIMEQIASHILQKLKERMAKLASVNIEEISLLRGDQLEIPKNDIRPYFTRFGLKSDGKLLDSALDWMHRAKKIYITKKPKAPGGRVVEFITLVQKTKPRPVNW